MTSDVDERLAALWCGLLNCGEVGPDADFFDCGGTSIAAVHLAALVQDEFGAPVDAIEVVTLRRLSALAEVIGERLANSGAGRAG